MSVRCFVAVELPEALKEPIASRTEKLRKSGADARWVRAENFHLTLKFLGSVPEEMLPELREALAGATRPHARFRLGFRGAGVFPSRKRPRVVWVGTHDSERLVDLQRDVEAAMEALGFEAEKRPYSAHLTIGRLKSQKRRDFLLRALDELVDESFGHFDVTEVALMKSTLKPGGAEYSRLYGAPLAGGA
jgi:2'-5' RNA ligase